MLNFESEEVLMFYNVENLFLPDPKPQFKSEPTISGHRNWDERKYFNKLHKLGNVFQWVKEENGVLPMLIGLAEVQNDQVLEDIIGLEVFNQDYGYIHYDSLDERGVDTALLYDKTKIKIIHSEAICLFFEIDEKNDEYIDTTRDVLYCKLQYDSLFLHFFIVHLPSKREKDVNQPKRGYILEKINQRIEKILKFGKNIPENGKNAVVVMGDFNENPNEVNVEKFLINSENTAFLKNYFLDIYKNNIFSTFHLKNGLLFDQIIISTDFLEKDFPLIFQKASVFKSEKICSWDKNERERPFRTYSGTRYLGGYSDHFPVLMRFLKK